MRKTKDVRKLEDCVIGGNAIVVPYDQRFEKDEKDDPQYEADELPKGIHHGAHKDLTGKDTFQNQVNRDDISNRVSHSLNDAKSPKPLKLKFFICKECGKVFKRRYRLTNHIESIHRGKKKYHCDVCDFKTAYRLSLQQHKRLHTKEKPHICKYCDKPFTTGSMLIEHLRMHTNTKPHKCKWCSKRFTAKSNYNKHIRIHSLERPFSCTECGKTFNHSTHRNRHMKSMHLTSDNHSKVICMICDKVLARKDHLVNHLKRVHYGMPTKFECDVCGKAYSRASDMRRHRRLMH